MAVSGEHASHPQTSGQGPSEPGRAAILFDRDGVLNVDEGYAFDPAGLTWIEGAREAVRAVNEAGVLALVVTNQSGIGRGYYTEAQMHAYHAAMSASLADIGGWIDAFYFCPFHEDAMQARYRRADHPDRKPNPGMLLRAMADHRVDPRHAVMIGDKPSDMEAAVRAGVRGVLFMDGDLCAVVAKLLSEIGGSEPASSSLKRKSSTSCHNR
jgi:D-glycero-D-manno-heptose 1,7-bisphosphate phosphatase